MPMTPHGYVSEAGPHVTESVGHGTRNDLYWLNANAGNPAHAYPTHAARTGFVLAATGRRREHCPACGTPLTDDACEHCGATLAADATRLMVQLGQRRTWAHTGE